MNGGIPYFPLDVHLDDKFDLIEAEFGLTGFAIVVKVLQKIYGGNGYYCEWTKDVALLFGRRFGPGCNVVSEIVSASIRRGIFDEDLFERYAILTSKGIQKRYFEAVSRRKQIEVINEYLLVKVAQICKNVNISFKNVDISGENVYIFKQRKEKERKEKKSKGEERKEGASAPPPSPYQTIGELYNKTCLSYPKIKCLSENRKKTLRARLNTYTISDFETLFQKAESSSFLKGKNGRDWQATFDWLIKDSNMAKVLDGNYDDREPGGGDPLYSDPYDHDELERIWWEKLQAGQKEGKRKGGGNGGDT